VDASNVEADNAQSFGNIKTVMLDGTKERDLDALLGLESGRLVVRSRDSGAVLQSMPYRAVVGATYTHAKRPRTKPVSAGVATIPDNLGSGFLGKAKNWLTLQSKTAFIVLRLDEDRDVKGVIAAIESHISAKVDLVDQDR
jgi:hypothetical protein